MKQNVIVIDDARSEFRKQLILAATIGYCANPEFSTCDYKPLANMVVRTTDAILQELENQQKQQDNG
jgi:hypothetical protein